MNPEFVAFLKNSGFIVVLNVQSLDGKSAGQWYGRADFTVWGDGHNDPANGEPIGFSLVPVPDSMRYGYEIASWELVSEL